MYGIKHDNGTIEAISRFRGLATVPAGFIEITKVEYENYLQIVSENTFVTYNATTKEIDVDMSQELDLKYYAKRKFLKNQLLYLSAEIDLINRMGESPVNAQSEFDAVLAEYTQPQST
jgi:hypothetical protein